LPLCSGCLRYDRTSRQPEGYLYQRTSLGRLCVVLDGVLLRFEDVFDLVLERLRSSYAGIETDLLAKPFHVSCASVCSGTACGIHLLLVCATYPYCKS
jgi:hypothetical protein